MRALPSGCLPLIPSSFLAAHGGTGAVATDIKDGKGSGFRVGEGPESGKGFAQAGSYGGDHAPEIARIELQAGVGGEIVGGFLIGTGATGSPAHEPGDGGGV